MSDIETELPEETGDVEEVLDSSTDGAEGAETPEIEEEASTAEEATPQGRVRGPDGKFAKAPAPEGEEAQDEGETAEATPAAQPDAQRGRPVQVKADGQLYDLPGAIIRDDGMVEMDAQAFDIVHRNIGQNVVAQRKIAHLTQQLQQTKEQTTAEAEYVKKVGEQYAQLALLSKQDPEQAFALLQGFADQLPTLQAQMEAEHWRKMAEQGQRAMQPDPQQVYVALETEFRQSLKETWDRGLQQPWAKGLTPEDIQQLADEFWEVRDSFKVIAQQDDPQAGVQAGQWFHDEAKQLRLMEQKAQFIVNLRKQQAKVAAATSRNAPAKVVAPPMGAGKRVGNTTTTAPSDKPRNRDEWQRKMYGW